MVHDCSSGCKFALSGKAVVEEREVVSHEGTTFMQDIGNSRYLLNSFFWVVTCVLYNQMILHYIITYFIRNLEYLH